MRVATIVGIILIVLGTAGLAWGGIRYNMDRQVADIGPVQVEAQTTKQIDIPLWASGVILLSGVVLVGVGARKR